jgi:catechol 2,3-dioxygenase-like lactoylglutathione lyase family enzyme
MLAHSPFIGFIPVTNLVASREFFVNTLGLTFVYENEYALVVDANGTKLRITPVPGLRPQPFTVAGWSSDDVPEMVRQLKAAGVTFNRFDGIDQDELDIWRAPGGDLVAWFSDPDGNVLSISGRARE